MKFGKQLDRSRVEEWASFYVDYAALKRIMTVCADEDDEGEREKLRKEWDTELWKEVAKVNAHHERTIKSLEDRVASFEEKWAELAEPNGHSETGTDDDERDRHKMKPGKSKVKNKDKVSTANSIKRYIEVSLLDVMVTTAHLVDYSSMNYTAFYKILKKHDKRAGGARRMPLLAVIEQEPFNEQTRIEALGDRIDNLNAALGGEAAERFHERNTRGHNDYAKLCFWMGFIAMGLINAAVMYHIPATNKEFSETKFMGTVPVFRFFFMLILLMWCIGWCTLVYERYKVNYVFLLNIDPKCPLESSSWLRLAATMSGAWLMVFWSYLADFKFSIFSSEGALASATVYPVILLVTMLLLMTVSRANGVGLKYKRHLLSCLRSVFLAPWVPVTFASNLLGDVLTSFTRPLADLVYSCCYFGRLLWRFRTHPSNFFLEHEGHHLKATEHHCQEVDSLMFISVILTFPYVLRLLQCLRRYRDDTSASQHLANAGKYSCSIIVTVIACLAPNSWLWWLSYTVATVYACAWDFTMDWGLSWKILFGLERPRHQMYPLRYYSIFAGLNIIGRTTWALSTLTPKASIESAYSQSFNFVLSSFEIYRRAQWGILRIEHEHLTNSSKYRTLCWVPPLAPLQAEEPVVGEINPQLLGQNDEAAAAGGRQGGVVRQPLRPLLQPLLEGAVARSRGHEVAAEVPSTHALVGPKTPAAPANDHVVCAANGTNGKSAANGTNGKSAHTKSLRPSLSDPPDPSRYAAGAAQAVRHHHDHSAWLPLSAASSSFCEQEHSRRHPSVAPALGCQDCV